jgi:hypothetical protein
MKEALAALLRPLSAPVDHAFLADKRQTGRGLRAQAAYPLTTASGSGNLTRCCGAWPAQKLNGIQIPWAPAPRVRPSSGRALFGAQRAGQELAAEMRGASFRSELTSEGGGTPETKANGDPRYER